MSWMKKRTNVLVFSTPERMFYFGIFSFYRDSNKCLYFANKEQMFEFLKNGLFSQIIRTKNNRTIVRKK